jgi:hypothetical protein
VRSRTVFVAAATAAALAIGLAGCGIPDGTEVRDLGAGPDPGYATAGGPGLGPPAREDAPTKETFVANFLAAVAGERDKAEERFRQYLTESSRALFKPDEDAGVNVVSVDPRGPEFKNAGEGSWQVTLKVTQVGVLTAEGSVGPPVLDETEYTFKIGGTGGAEGWFVTDPPPVLLLSTQALTAYYTPRTLYFWSFDRSTLVPDSRYMPNEVDEGRQPTWIVEWVVKGPSEWLVPAVSQLKDGSQSMQNVPYPNDRLEVVLNPVAAEQQAPAARRVDDMVEQLGIQLMWSLRPYLREALDLRIEGQSAREFRPDERFESFNAAHRPANPPGHLPERFALYRGKIHRLKGSPGGGTQPLPQLLLQEGVNRGIDSAALARETSGEGTLTAAALVTQQGQQFQLRVGSAFGDGARPFDTSRSYGQAMGRPVWLKAPMDTGLVTVAGNLHRFTLDDADLQRVDLPPALAGKVRDVSAAPDGRRIAVAAGRKVYVLGVTRDDTSVVEVEEPREVPTRLRDVAAVDWSEETKIAVAGTGPDNKPVVWQVSLDGAAVDQPVEDAGGPVEHLASYPDDPVPFTPISVTVMYARGGSAYDLAGGNGLIEAGEVVGASGEFDPAQVTAPFFLLD